MDARWQIRLLRAEEVGLNKLMFFAVFRLLEHNCTHRCRNSRLDKNFHHELLKIL
jgi:hypothetical protein